MTQEMKTLAELLLRAGAIKQDEIDFAQQGASDHWRKVE